MCETRRVLKIFLKHSEMCITGWNAILETSIVASPLFIVIRNNACHIASPAKSGETQNRWNYNCAVLVPNYT